MEIYTFFILKVKKKKSYILVSPSQGLEILVIDSLKLLYMYCMFKYDHKPLSQLIVSYVLLSFCVYLPPLITF